MTESDKKNMLEAFENVEDLSRVLQQMPNTFPLALVFLMNHYHITIERLSEYSGVGLSTIKRLRKQESQMTSLNTVVRLCIGMRLNPLVSNELIKRCPVRPLFSEKDILYQQLLIYYENWTFEEREYIFEYIEQIKSF